MGRDLARRLSEGSVTLDRFELRSELGVGSFGYVFRAWDPRLQRVVALKVQRAGSLASQEEVERFLREARSAAQLKHPSIVAIYEIAQTEDNVWFLVCEYVDGETIEAWIRREVGMPPVLALKIVGQVASALAAAQKEGIIHRDIKPSNIMLVESEDEELVVKVIDFGLAKSIESAPDSATVTLTQGGFLGTPHLHGFRIAYAYLSELEMRNALTIVADALRALG